MAVKATVQHLEGSRVSLEVEVAPDEVQRSLDEAYRRLAQRVRVPGFRPGKVPPAVIRARLGKQPVYDEALELILPRAYREAVDAQGLEPVDDPRFDIVQMEDDKPLVFKAEVTVKPEVKLGACRGLKLEKSAHHVTDGDVDRVLRRLQERLAVLEPADGPVQRGHFVELDYEALLDGKPFRGGAARGRTIEMGQGQMVPGFDEAIEGMRVGERREFQLTIPAEYPDKELAGHTLSFTVTVQAIKSRRLPELDDELAKDLGPYASLDELRRVIREELQKAADQRAQQELRRQAVERVVQSASVEIPEPMLRRRTDALLRELAERLARQGLTVERYLELTGRSAAELVASVEPEARRQLTQELVLDAVARAEGLEADPAEIDRRVNEWVPDEPARGKPAEARREAARREALRQDLRRQLGAAMRRDRAIDWLVEHAEVEQRPVEGVQDEDLVALVAARVEGASQAGGTAA